MGVNRTIGCIALVFLLVSDSSTNALSMNERHNENRPLLISRRGSMKSVAASSLFVLGIQNANAVVSDNTNSILIPAANPGARAAYVGETQTSAAAAAEWKSMIATKLGTDRIVNGKELSGLSNSPILFGGSGDREVYYPDFMFGAWNVSSTLVQKTYPYGKNYVYSSYVEGSPRNRQEQVGDTTTYEAHYFSTLADTMSNQVTVNLGLGIPKAKIIADRRYNAFSMNQAYQHLVPITDVTWDPRTDPTRLTLQFATMTTDLKPVGQRRAEVYLTNRQTESYDDAKHFSVAERSRTTSLAPGDVSVTDLETITEFILDETDPNHVQAISRIAVFLTPNPNSREGILWQQVGGNAVAFFDYILDMHRILEPFNDIPNNNTNDAKLPEAKTINYRPCVTTYKDVTQCQ